MRFVTTIVIAASLVLVSRGQERKPPLTLQSIELLVRDLPDERLAVEVRQRGVAPLIRWREVQRLRNLGIGPATLSALEPFVQPLTLTLIVEPPMAGLAVSITSRGSNIVTSNRIGTTDSTGTAVIDGLRPGAYRVNVTPPQTHRFIEREIVLSDEGSLEHITLMPAPARLSVLVHDAKVAIRSLGSYNGPVRNLEVPAGTHEVSVSKAGHLTYTTSLTVTPGEEISIAPTLKREPVQYPVVHRHNWGRCSGTLIVSDDILKYQQSDSPGADSFEVQTTHISKVTQWSENQLEILLTDGRKLHFAHGVMKPTDKRVSGVMLKDHVDLRPIRPVIEAIQRAQAARR